MTPRATAVTPRPRGSRRARRSLVAPLVLVGAAWAGIVGASLVPAAAAPPPGTTRWSRFRHVPAVVDLTHPRTDGSLTVAANGRLLRLPPGSGPVRFADGYTTAKGPEPYIALSTGETPDGAGCSFGPDRVYALEPDKTHPGVIQIDAAGQARRFVNLPAGLAPGGIAFDDVGRFGHRLLVTASAPGGITVDAVDCAGHVGTVTAHAPSMEGGVIVAPATFGAFAGDLIGADEHSGRLVAVAPDGTAAVVARSGLPSGGDIGVESIGVVPADLAGVSAYLADRRSPGNPHPGTDSILRLTGAQLIRAGAEPGDLLVATEGAAKTILVHCASTCTVRHVADGLAVSHAEGHIVFAPG